MAYADGNSGNSRKAFTGGTVALIQAGLALALINGFAVHFIPDAPPPRLQGTQIPIRPLPPEPTETPEPVPQKPVVQHTLIKTPEPKPPLAVEPPVDLTTAVRVDPPGGSDDLIFIRPFIPANPPPRFTPKAARPGNIAAQWVTTNDYPTSDIRLGHTGSVR
ncbi:MAG: energy transducer TonB, partial [Novosphingobium sp.]